eukprot:COSAG06_NODE_1027_length_11028_cov_3.385031_11_plen_169_part_00
MSEATFFLADGDPRVERIPTLYGAPKLEDGSTPVRGTLYCRSLGSALSCLVCSCSVLSCLALSRLVWSGLVWSCLVRVRRTTNEHRFLNTAFARGLLGPCRCCRRRSVCRDRKVPLRSSTTRHTPTDRGNTTQATQVRKRSHPKTASFLSAFPMFVPSLSWQNDRFYI